MHKNLIRLTHITRYLFLVALLSSCSLPTKITSQVFVAFNSNPDATGRPSPLVVRVYQLKSNTIFESADFYKIYDEEQATLGGDLLSREEYEFAPGASRKINLKVAHEDARFIGVIAAYRDIDDAHWRESLPLVLKERNNLVINIGKQTVTINQQKL